MNLTRFLPTLAFAALSVFGSSATAAPGDLDLSFGGTGKLTTDILGNNDIGYSVAIQNDGKILVAGHAILSGSYAFSVARYNTDGSLDGNFNGNGKVTTDFGSGDDYVRSVVVQDDGKILVAGSARVGSGDDFALVRYNADGSLDLNFNGTGKVTTAIGSADDYGNSVTVQSDGRIVVAGSSFIGDSYEFAVVRYNADGSLDLSFNGTGMTTTNFALGEDVGNSVVALSDGRIVVAGYAYNGANYDFALVRYDANGSLDTSFNGTGKVITAVGSRDDVAYGVALQTDGRIVVAGYSVVTENNADFSVARYNVDGSLDMSFNGTGVVTTAIGSGYDVGNSIVVQDDGKIVVAGTSSNGNDKDFALVRYGADGSLDSGFGDTGYVTTDFGNADDFGNSVGVQSDGSIVVAGYSYIGNNYDFSLARYEAIPEPSTFTLLNFAFASFLGFMRPRLKSKVRLAQVVASE
jgi:uncharacterized delta-60 repeat protein